MVVVCFCRWNMSSISLLPGAKVLFAHVLENTLDLCMSMFDWSVSRVSVSACTQSSTYALLLCACMSASGPHCSVRKIPWMYRKCVYTLFLHSCLCVVFFTQYVPVIVNVCLCFNRCLYATISMFPVQFVTIYATACNYDESMCDNLHTCLAVSFLCV